MSVCNKTACVLLALLVLPARPAKAEHYEVFVLAGQSNMDGRGQAKDLVGPLAKYAQPQVDVLIDYSNSGTRGTLLKSDGWAPLQPGYSVAPAGKVTALPSPTFGPEIGFGRAIADGMTGKHVALIKFCEGGTNLKSQWNPEVRKKLYDQCLAHIETSLAALKTRDDSYALRGLVWHQGESDSELPAGEYDKLLEQLLARVRADLKEPALPIVIGEVYDNGKRDAVRAAEKAVAKSTPHAAFASAEGLKTSDKGTHFDAASQIELGVRMAKAMLPLLEEKAAQR